MTYEALNLMPILPEIAVAATACLVLLVDLYAAENGRSLAHGLTLLGLVLAIGLTGLAGGGEPVGESRSKATNAYKQSDSSSRPK